MRIRYNFVLIINFGFFFSNQYFTCLFMMQTSKFRDELHKASVTERFVALRNATVRYQKALRSAL